MKGFKTGGGSRKGKPNKVTAKLKDMILTALSDAGGIEYLKARALDTPGPFLTLLGKVLPTQVSGDPENPVVVDYKLQQLEGLIAKIDSIGVAPIEPTEPTE